MRQVILDYSATATTAAASAAQVECQAWLALAHSRFHAQYWDSPGIVWNSEISLSTKYVILSVAASQWRLKSRIRKQRMTFFCGHILSVTVCFYGNCS